MPKTGKIDEGILRRTILRIVNGQKGITEGMCGIGTDAGVFRMSGDLQAGMASATVTGMNCFAIRLALIRACNSLRAAFGTPAYAVLQLVLPETVTEELLKAWMQEAVNTCREEKVLLVNGHTMVSREVSEAVISVTVTGEVQKVPEPETFAGLDVVMTKAAGISGTALLAACKEETLKQHFAGSFIVNMKNKENFISVREEAQCAVCTGVTAMHDVSQGGVFGALWELAERLQTGVRVNLHHIPIYQDTIELCELFDINPYQLCGDGSLLMISEHGEHLVENLKALQIPSAVIGQLTKAKDRILTYGEEVRYLEPNRVEEYERARK